MKRMTLGMLAGLLVMAAGGVSQAQQMKDPPRPFIAWTKEEAAAAKKKIETQDWARREYDAMMASKTGQVWARLFAYSVMGDMKAADEEKKYLLSFVGAPVDTARAWADNYLNVLRYDVLYDLLTEKERADVEATFRTHIEWQLTQDKRVYEKFNWLPNMQWCRPFSTYLMAVALKDEALIKKCFNDRAGWKYYFDEYVSDGYFYNEEFGKQYSMNGEMILWCLAMDRLGLPEMGFDFKGKGGATLKNYLWAYVMISYPKVYLGDEPSDPKARPHLAHVAMGDAKGGAGFRGIGRGYAFQQSFVRGYTPRDGEGGEVRFTYNNMNGRDHKDRIIEKLNGPLWFEAMHRRYPDAGFDWILTQMRSRDDDRYYPSLWFGIDPIDPAKVKAPMAPSGVFSERGFGILRAEESGAYWDSPLPAMSFRMATPYVHQVSDSFSLLGLYAFHRPLYINRQVSSNYAGVDPGWSNSLRSHSGVMIDGREPANTSEHTIRKDFGKDAKFAAVRTKKMWADVDAERMYVLTDQYLLDVYALKSPYPRNYQWQVQALGSAVAGNPEEWAPTRNLVGTTYDVANEKSFVAGDKPWSVFAVQRTAGSDPEFSGMGEKWFRDRVGVKMMMAGEEGTIAYTATGPAFPTMKDRLNYGAIEPGNTVIAASRNKKATAFVAVHQPFKGKVGHLNVEVKERGEDSIKLVVQRGATLDEIELKWGDAAGEKGFEFKTHLQQAKVGQSVGVVASQWGNAMQTLKAGGEVKARLWLGNVGESASQGTLKFTVPSGITLEPAEVGLNVEGGAEREVEFVIRADAKAEHQVYTLLPEVTYPAGGVRVPVQMEPLKVAVGVVNEAYQIWPQDFAKTIYAPRYVARYYHQKTTAAEFLLDPEGNRRFDGRELPRVSLAPVGDAKAKWEEQKVGGFLDFSPRPRVEADGRKFLSDTGTHPHGRRSAFEYRFYEDWLWVKFKDSGGREAVFDWSVNVARAGQFAEAKLPQIVRVIGRDGSQVEVGKAKDGTEIAAVFDRPVGYRYGELMLYPAGAKLRVTDRGKGLFQVVQPGDAPMAFTFATDEESAGLVEKWMNQGAPADVPPWRQGDMGR